jgi:hypothetical protein
VAAQLARQGGPAAVELGGARARQRVETAAGSGRAALARRVLPGQPPLAQPRI